MDDKYFSQTANLVLRTFDINTVLADADNSIGTMSGNGAYLTWKNINLRYLLGDMWDKYEYFNIELLNVGRVAPTNGGLNDDSISMSIWLSGLSFLDECYSVPRKLKTNEACMGLIQLNTNQNTGTSLFGKTPSTAPFRKDKEITDITINLTISAKVNIH
ncbi:MAG: hypothetical protein EOO06_19580 [Chitinophagaceae bacterium]|nr:MAG: hypothetical protein EOO06_19580 [Chitinophagaceae bacterium]